MNFSGVKFILTDIEGTTTSVDFVYQTLFPYFRNHLVDLKQMQHMESVKVQFDEVRKLAKEEGVLLENADDIIEQLRTWSLADKKITPLKELQGILWQKGYETGEIKGHVFEEVPEVLIEWKKQGHTLGVYSSGSVAAQKLIFGYSIAGDLTPLFSAYFDTKIGHKREENSYQKIAQELKLAPKAILFLSDIKEELEAAEKAGYQTCQLVRENNMACWPQVASSFKEIKIIA